MNRDLMSRVERLESRLKWLLFGWACSLVVLALLFAGAPKALTALQPEQLRVRSLAIVDEKGTERIRIAAPLPDAVVEGKPMHRRSPANGIQLNDAQGSERGGLGMLDDGTMVLCFDRRGIEATCNYVMPSGEAGFAVADENGKERAQLVLSPGKEILLALNDGTEKTRVSLRVNGDGSAKIQLHGKDGKVLWSEPRAEQ